MMMIEIIIIMMMMMMMMMILINVYILMLGMDLFNTKEVVIIPFVYSVDDDDDDRQMDDGKEKGFGKRDLLMTAAYIAKPKQLSVW